MKDVTYRYLPPVGPREPSESVTKPLADFVQDIPYFLTFDLIPPLAIMNEEFNAGEDDAGMSGGCVWEPFSISEGEYVELVQELLGRGLRYAEPPAWVQNKTDWHIWKFEYEVGIPADEHYRLSREDDKWAKLKNRAVEEGDEERMLECHLKGIEAGQQLADFVSSYIRTYHRKKGIRHNGRN